MKGKSQKPAKLGMVTLSISEAREADDATAGLCADYSGFLRDDGTYQPASNEERDKAKIPQGRKGWTPAPDYALHLARKIDSGAIGRCLKNAADSRHEFMPAAWRCGIEGCVRCDVPIPPLKLTPSGKMRYEKFAGKGSGMGEVAAAQAKPSAGQPASTKPIERTDATAPSSAPVVRVEEYGKYGCGVGETHGGIDSQQQSRPGNSEPGKQECSLPPVPFSEAEAKKRYLEAIDRGLSDAEAREEGWPTAPSPVPVAGAKGEPEYFIAVVNGGPHSG